MKSILTILGVICLVFKITAQNKVYENQIDQLYDKGYKHLFVHKDSANFYFDKIYKEALENNDLENVFDALITSNRNAGFFNDLKRFSANLTLLDSLFKVKNQYLDSLPNKLYLIHSANYDWGNYNFKINNFNASRNSFSQIINSIEKLPDTVINKDLEDLLSVSYSFIAKMYADEDKYDLAKQFYNKNIRFIQETKPDDYENLNSNYSLLAEVYQKEERLEKSNNYFLKSLKYALNNNGSSNSIITSTSNIAQNHIRLKNADSAVYYLSISRKKMSVGHHYLPSYHQVKSEIVLLSQDYTSALIELDSALLLEQEKWGTAKHLGMAIIHQKMGLIHYEQDDFDKALNQYSIGLNQLSSSNSNIDRIFLIKMLKNKAYALNSIKQQDPYSNTLVTVNQGLKVLNNLKPTFKSESDKLVLIEDAFPLFESGMEAAYQLYQSSKDEKYIDQAFDYAEKSKSVLLLEALLGTKATKFANIPKDILERERQLKSEITFVEKQRNRAKEETSELEDQLFALKEEHRQLIKQIENDYKTYYDLKYNTETFSLFDTQKRLASDEKMISYFYGNHAIYAIGVDKVSKQIERIPISVSFENDIKSVHRMLGDPKSDVVALSKASYKLYASLVAPFMTSEEKKRLIIISDGLLNYIPFSALNTSAEELSYLTEHHAVSYANSATLLAQLKEQQSKNVKLLAFAPSFEGAQVKHDPSRGNLLPLPHNKREVEQILGSFKGRSFLNKNASLQNFTSQLSNFGMLHLATHAVFDDESPEYSYLAFSNVDKEEDLLYVSDLYNLQIDANLVTLSACESGVGELKRGEGFMSLARGFFYSGASSIASTLWKINDASTTDLMDSFYKNLAAGKAKDMALQKSQIDFLNANRQNNLSHPYYWSAFVISGNTSPLVTTNYWLWIVIGILAVSAFGIFLLRKKRS